MMSKFDPENAVSLDTVDPARMVGFRAARSGVLPCEPSGIGWKLKLILEPVIAGILVLVLWPLFLAIALAITVESGLPILFVQPRFGRGGAPFSMFKFRTMRTHLCDLSGAQQTGDIDPRITRVGRFLRKTSLDELPQLLNVVSGHMALIGPRAHPCGMRVQGFLCETLDPRYHDRHVVRTGVTGWAQINGSRGAVKSADMLYRRVSLDLEYIENWTLLMDIRILLRTIVVVAKREQAQ